MEISGLIRSVCPPEFLVSVMQDRATLLRLMPEGTKLDQISPGRFAFSVTKGFGPVKLTLPGQLSLTPTGEGQDQVLTARAAHIIGGKVDLDLTLTFDATGQQTRLAYSGEIAATGLAGRVLRENRAKVNAVLKTLLTRLKLHAEARLRQSTATT